MRVGLVDQGRTHHTVPPILLLVNFYLNEMTLNDILLQLLVSQYNRFISFCTMWTAGFMKLAAECSMHCRTCSAALHVLLLAFLSGMYFLEFHTPCCSDVFWSHFCCFLLEALLTLKRRKKKTAEGEMWNCPQETMTIN